MRPDCFEQHPGGVFARLVRYLLTGERKHAEGEENPLAGSGLFWLRKIIRSRLLPLIIGILVMFLWLPALAYYNPGKPSGFVNDFAGLLNQPDRAVLEQKLHAYEKETGHEITVVTIASLQGDTIENFAVKLFEEWGIGKNKADNGVLLLVARDDRAVRIEVGYGLEGVITDAESFWIIQNVITPAFRAGDYAQGLNLAIDALSQAAREEIVTTDRMSSPNVSWNPLWLLIVVFAGLQILLKIFAATKSWWLGGVIGGAAALIIGLIAASIVSGLIAAVFLVPLGLAIDYAASRRGPGGPGGRWWVGPFGGGGFGGGGGGFGGFGGGRSGGGGSSGRW